MNTFLNVTHFRNGDAINYIEDPVEWEIAIDKGIPAYCYYNNYDNGIGCIYNIHAWNDERGLIPNGWRSLDNNDIKSLKLNTYYPYIV